MNLGGVLLAVSTFEVGGTERQTVRLAAELRKRGIDVHVLVLRRTGPLDEVLVEAHVPIHEVGLGQLRVRRADGRTDLLRSARHVLPALWRILRTLQRLRPDVVAANLFLTYAIVLPLAVVARVPVRLAGRRNLAIGTEGLDRRVHAVLARVADWSATGHLCNADAVAEVVRREGVAEERIHVIPNGLDLPRPAEDVTIQPPRAVVLANLIDYKGHVDVLDAVALFDAPPTVDCWGEGPERVALERAVTERGLDGVVCFPGRADAPADVLSGYQFAIHPSHQEGMPNAVLEELATGLPVVGTRVGGIPELITDGVTGRLVPAKSPEELASAIASLVDDPQLRQRMGAAARGAAEEYGWSRCTDRHVTLFSRLLVAR